LEIYHESDTRMSILGHKINTTNALVFQFSSSAVAGVVAELALTQGFKC